MQRLVQFGRPNSSTLGSQNLISSLWDEISALRHDVYSNELNQYQSEISGILEDPGEYFIALISGESLIGYVSINLVAESGFRISKYFTNEAMDKLSELYDSENQKTSEIRGLTVKDEYRGKNHGMTLMLAALKFSNAEKASDIIAMAHTEVLPMYREMGMRILDKYSVKAGEILFHPMHLSVKQALARVGSLLDSIEIEDFTDEDAACYHGGASWEKSGFDFNLRGQLVVADVLDSPFPPCPEAIEAISQHLSICCQESPPTQCEQLIETIAETRGVPPENVLVSSGSSSLMFSLLPRLLKEDSKVLILSPMYGEYLHILTHLIRCNVTHFPLYPDDDFKIDKEGLILESRNHDAVIFVNPNSPTGVYCREMGEIVKSILKVGEGESNCKTVWIDETYIEYVRDGDSLESLTSDYEQLIVCKSMSKCYALSGLRVAYAVSSKASLLRRYIPPWAVSLPAQIGAIEALGNPDYYRNQYEIIHQNRRELSTSLSQLGFKVYPGVANYILTELPRERSILSSEFVQSCRKQGIYVRDAENMGLTLNSSFVRFAVRLKEENDRIIRCVKEIMNS